MRRRDFLSKGSLLAGVGLLGLRAQALARADSAAAISSAVEWPAAPVLPVPPLARVNARPDRFIRMSVGLRPFRPAGPRLEAERVGEKLVVHNYGHGGSGWSLSWGTGAEVVKLALGSGARSVGVIGCGAIGLTTALLLQRAGAKVTIYAKDRPPLVTSSYATGVWSPASRFCLKSFETPALGQRWADWCVRSHGDFQTFLGLPGTPVRWVDRYALSDVPWDELRVLRQAEARERGEPEFANMRDFAPSLTPEAEDLAEGAHPFPAPFVRRSSNMVFNLTALSRRLMDDFLLNGGQMETRTFHRAGELAALPEPALVNATGLGARELFGDRTLIPVRGQLGVLIPQPEVDYGLSGAGFSMVPREDGLVVQTSGERDFGSEDLTPDRAESEGALLALAHVMRGMRV
jgi:glycine/D-amino acid oxidase-like deaminating enzyme